MADGSSKSGQPEAEGGKDVESQLGVDQIRDTEKQQEIKTYIEKNLTQEQRERIRGKAGADLSRLQQQIVLVNQGKSTLDVVKKEIDQAGGAGNAAAEPEKPKAPETAPAAAQPAVADVPKSPAAPETPATEEEGENDGMLDQLVQKSDPSTLQKIGDVVKSIISKIPLIGGLIAGAFFSKKTLDKLGVKGSTGFSLDNLFGAKTPEEAKEKEKKAKTILRRDFQIEKVEELEVLSLTPVKDFLKPDFLAKNPGKFDPKRYEKFVQALKRNGADAATDEKVKVFEFVITKTDEWKSL